MNHSNRRRRRDNRSNALNFEVLERRCMMAADLGGTGLAHQFDAFNQTSYSALAYGDEAGNSFRDARDIGKLDGTQNFKDRVDWSDRRDFYRFELERNGEVSLNLTGLSSDIDLYLFNEQGQFVDSSYRGGASNETITQRLEAGGYYVLVVPYGLAASDYQLEVRATLDSESGTSPDKAGNTFREARDVGLIDRSRSFEDRVDRSDRADFYRFQVGLNDGVNIELNRLQGDVDLYLFDASERLLGQSFKGGSQSESILAPLQSGTYFVLVSPWQGAESSYQLTISTLKDSTEPPTNEPPTNEPPTNEPPTNEPPTNEPPTNEPPTNEPPTNEPPTNEPPTNEPPTNEPPTNEPPTNEPPNSGTQPLPNVPNFGGSQDWNLNRVNAPEAWARGYTGQGVVIAVIDTGVDRQHNDLSSNLWRNPGEVAGDGIDNDNNGQVDDIYGWNFVNNNNNTNDGNRHGTHVAGTIAALRNSTGATGVAYGSRIMPVRVLDAQGRGSSQSVANGIRYAVDNGANIINLSLGGAFDFAIQSALEYARQTGVFVVVASGNSSSSVPSFPARHSATLDNVISVGAHDRNDQRTNFSNGVGASGARQVDAPGTGIFSTIPGNQYGNLSGTSMAAPHVAGLAALALSANSNLTPGQLRQMILGGANRSIFGSDSIGGINAAMTVAMALGAPAQNTASSTSSGSQFANPVSPTYATAAILDGFIVGLAGTDSSADALSNPSLLMAMASSSDLDDPEINRAATPLPVLVLADKMDLAIVDAIIVDEQNKSMSINDRLNDGYESANLLNVEATDALFTDESFLATLV